MEGGRFQGEGKGGDSVVRTGYPALFYRGMLFFGWKGQLDSFGVVSFFVRSVTDDVWRLISRHHLSFKAMELFYGVPFVQPRIRNHMHPAFEASNKVGKKSETEPTGLNFISPA